MAEIRNTDTATGRDPGLIEQLIAFKVFGSRKNTLSLEPFFDGMELSLLDYMTIRDLIGYAGCQDARPLAVILMCLFSSLQEGSLCLELAEDQVLSHLPGDLRAEAKAVFRGFLSALSDGNYRHLIAEAGTAYLPLVLDDSTGRRLLYFQKHYVHEGRLKRRIEDFIAVLPSEHPEDGSVDELLDEIYSDPMVLRTGPERTPIVRDPHQTAAIRLALTTPFSIISGGPGTGKTALIANLLRCLIRQGFQTTQIILAAPTGRAAQRMTESIQENIASIASPADSDLALLSLKGSTLHKLLAYRRHTHEFTHRRTNPLPASVVVMDEVSMVDVVMMDQFLQAVDPTQTSLILLGDKHQLPSVEAGAVFSEMIPDGSKAARFEGRLTVLEKTYRTETNLLELATQANEGKLPDVEPVTFGEAIGMASDRWALVKDEGNRQWQAHLSQWAEETYLTPPAADMRSYADWLGIAAEMQSDAVLATEAGIALLNGLFSIAQRARILSVLRKGIRGCTMINRLISSRLTPAFDMAARRRSEGFSGAPIIITRNDYAKSLYNGDVGIILKDADGAYRAYFARAGDYISFPVGLLPSWEYAFAMTVHKSQGSEYDDVLLVLPEDVDHRLLTREIIYTGITRAKHRVMIYGSRQALDAALSRKILRRSGLAW